MPTVTIKTHLCVPAETAFDAARDITLHCRTAARTQERAVAGVTAGLIGLGEEVTFEGVHFGVRQRLTACVTEFNRPHCFVDEMVRGAFQSMRHVHEFASDSEGTWMTDILVWTSPLGILGRLADKLFLEAHMKRFVMERNGRLKQIVEQNTEEPSVV